jgi:anti-anti-sigma factor
MGEYMAKDSRGTAKKVIKPGKDIVASMVMGLKGQFVSSINAGIKEITMDFIGIENIDSAGLGLILAANNSLIGAGGRLRLKNVSEKIQKSFQIMKLDKYLIEN